MGEQYVCRGRAEQANHAVHDMHMILVILRAKQQATRGKRPNLAVHAPSLEFEKDIST